MSEIKVFSTLPESRGGALGRGRKGNPNLLQFPISDDNVWQALPKMTKDECYYVADRYQQKAEPLLRRSQFFVNVGDQLAANQTVADVFTGEDLAVLWDTFVNPVDPPADEPEGNAA